MHSLKFDASNFGQLELEVALLAGGDQFLRGHHFLLLRLLSLQIPLHSLLLPLELRHLLVGKGASINLIKEKGGLLLSVAVLVISHDLVQYCRVNTGLLEFGVLIVLSDLLLLLTVLLRLLLGLLGLGLHAFITMFNLLDD